MSKINKNTSKKIFAISFALAILFIGGQRIVQNENLGTNSSEIFNDAPKVKVGNIKFPNNSSSLIPGTSIRGEMKITKEAGRSIEYSGNLNKDYQNSFTKTLLVDVTIDEKLVSEKIPYDSLRIEPQKMGSLDVEDVIAIEIFSPFDQKLQNVSDSNFKLKIKFDLKEIFE